MSFAVPGSGESFVRVEIHDVTGRLLRTLVSRSLPPGRHSVDWNGADAQGRPVSGGLYLCRATCLGETETRRVIVLR